MRHPFTRAGVRRRPVSRRVARVLVGAALTVAAFAWSAAPAKADFRLCNNTGNRVGIAIGYKENEGWTTQGRWNISPRSSETALRGAPVAPSCYFYARDYDAGR